MGHDSEEKKSKKERRTSGVATLPVAEVFVERPTDGDGDVNMDATAVEIGLKDKKKKDKAHKLILPVEQLSPIAHPLATDKMVKKVFKTVKRAAKQSQVKRGVKEVMKGMRKGDKGILIIAADISPMDIISPLPVFAEDNNIPYIFVASKEDLAKACLTKRPTSCVLVVPTMKVRRPKHVIDGEVEDYAELYAEVFDEVKKMVSAGPEHQHTPGMTETPQDERLLL